MLQMKSKWPNGRNEHIILFTQDDVSVPIFIAHHYDFELEDMECWSNIDEINQHVDVYGFCYGIERAATSVLEKRLVSCYL